MNSLVPHDLFARNANYWHEFCANAFEKMIFSTRSPGRSQISATLSTNVTHVSMAVTHVFCVRIEKT